MLPRASPFAEAPSGILMWTIPVATCTNGKFWIRRWGASWREITRHTFRLLFNNPPCANEDVKVIVAVTKCNTIRRDTLSMHVFSVPEYTITPGAVTVCAGEPVNFSVSPTPGSGNLSWDFGDGNGATTSTPIYAYPNSASQAVYTPVATIENPEGCPTTVVAQGGPVTVKPAPVAHVSPDNLFGYGSFNTTLTATVTTSFGSTTNYDWTGSVLTGTARWCRGRYL